MRTGASRVSSGFGDLYPKKESLALSIIRFAHCRGIDRDRAPIPLQPRWQFLVRFEVHDNPPFTFTNQIGDAFYECAVFELQRNR